MTVLALVGQFFTGWHEYNDELQDLGLAQLSAGQYFTSGHFIEATFENWESEFLSIMGVVVLSVFLRQQGSPQSKPVDAANSETGA